MSDLVKELSEIASRVAAIAKAKGADDAEAIIRDGSELTTKVRMGEAELVQEAGSRAVGLRVFCDKRSAVTYSSDMRPEALEAWVENTVALAKLSEPDDLNTLPDGGFATEFPDLDLYDANAEGVTAEQAIKLAIRGEKAALGYDERITNSQGATWSRVLGGMAFANTAGFVGGSRGSYVSFYVEPVCDEPDGKKRNGSWWTASRFLDQLASPEEVGEEAARRTVRQLGSTKIATGDRVVIFEPEVARSLVSTVFGVANGSSFYRKSTYLLEREGTPIASKLVTIEDDPRILQAPGSKTFDGDGLPTHKNVLVDAGVLKTVLCDTYTARKLGRESTAFGGPRRWRGPWAYEQQPLHESGHQQPRANHGGQRGRSLRDQHDGLWLQCGDRRLLARSGGLSYRRRQTRAAGFGNHHFVKLRHHAQRHRHVG